jgi:hypothetical protein
MIAQRAHDADMGETARAATRKHQADAAPGQQAGDAFDVIVAANMVQLRVAHDDLPGAPAAVQDLATLQQYEMTRPLHVAVRLDIDELGPGAGRRCGIGRQHEAVGLAHAQFTPFALFGVGQIQHEAKARLDRAEPGAGVAEAGFRVDQRAAAVAAERLAQLHGKPARVDTGIVRQHRERARGGQRPPHGPRDQPLHGQPCRLQHRFRMMLDQRREAAPRQAQQLRIAQRSHRRRTRLVDDQAEFADRLAGSDDTIENEAPVDVRLECAEAAGLEHVQRVGFLAEFEQDRTAGQGEPFQLAFEFGERGRVEVAEQGHIAQQFAGVERSCAGWAIAHPRPGCRSVYMLAQSGGSAARRACTLIFAG